ncbi:MAG: hypothetical protein ACTSXC_03110 [Candidatus Freyarchaeota archaeon]
MSPFFKNGTVALAHPLLESPENYRGIEVRGTLQGAGPFDLTIGPYVSVKNVSKYEFSFKPKAEEVRRGLQMLIGNRARRIITKDFLLKTVELYGWMTDNWWFVVPLSLAEEPADVKVNGTSTETGGATFNLYFLDKENFEKWKAGLPFTAYFAGKGQPSYSFSFVVPSEKSKAEVYYVVERVGEAGFGAPKLKVFISAKATYEQPADNKVSYHVEMVWEERTYAHVLGGLIAGGVFAFLGLSLLLAALVVKLVFKR